MKLLSKTINLINKLPKSYFNFGKFRKFTSISKVFSVSSPRPTDDIDIFSSLYVADKYGSLLYKAITPIIDLRDYRDRWKEILELCKVREMNINLSINFFEKINELIENQTKYEESVQLSKELLEQKKHLQLDKENVANSTGPLDKIKLEIHELKEEKFKLETIIIPVLLGLPNCLHLRTKSERVLKKECLINNDNDSLNFNHMKLGEISKTIEFTTISPNGYFLIGKVALLEISLIEYFEKGLYKSNLSRLSAPHLIKSPIVEGCNRNPFSNETSFRIGGKDAKKGNTQHVVGGASLETLIGYFTNRQIASTDLPRNIYSIGRRYSIENALLNDSKGLYTSPQSSEIGLLSICNDEQSAIEVFDRTVAILQELFDRLKLPIQTVQLSVSELNLNESLRVQFEIWSPYYKTYQNCAHVSFYGNYLSKKLNILCNKTNAGNTRITEPAYCIGGCALSAPVLIAAIMENLQKNDGTFDVPDALLEYL